MDCPRHLPEVMLTMLVLTLLALIANSVPLAAWVPVICVGELLACGLAVIASACMDIVRWISQSRISQIVKAGKDAA